MKAELAEKDNALAAARTAAHSTTMNSQEVIESNELFIG